MTNPTPEQIDAVADAIAVAHDRGAYWSPQVSARGVLTTTDADAQEALAANLPTDVIRAECERRGGNHWREMTEADEAREDW